MDVAAVKDLSDYQVHALTHLIGRQQLYSLLIVKILNFFVFNEILLSLGLCIL